MQGSTLQLRFDRVDQANRRDAVGTVAPSERLMNWPEYDGGRNPHGDDFLVMIELPEPV